MFRLKVHRRVRFEINPLDLYSSRPYSGTRDDVVDESEVLEEDFFDSYKNKAGGDINVLNENDFWDYVYSRVWSGRLRIREGNLLRTLIRVS